jgi:nicotinate phosphoribosyltransferase
MHNGELLKPLDSLEAIAQRTRDSVRSLPKSIRHIAEPTSLEAKIDI